MKKRRKEKAITSRKSGSRPARNDSSADSTKEEQQTTESAINPNHYPPNDLPLLGACGIQEILDAPRPTATQIEELHKDLERTQLKITWSLDRTDRHERVASATRSSHQIGFKLKKSAVAGAKANIGQSLRAKEDRGKVSDDGETINQIIGKLATRGEHRAEPSRRLWFHFMAKLSAHGLDPEEILHADPAKTCCKYNFQNKKGWKKITIGQFAKVVSAYRTEKKKLP